MTLSGAPNIILSLEVGKADNAEQGDQVQKCRHDDHVKNATIVLLLEDEVCLWDHAAEENSEEEERQTVRQVQ